MNRRSLLLGGVVASVAGILGVKARPVEVAATPTTIDLLRDAEIKESSLPHSGAEGDVHVSLNPTKVWLSVKGRWVEWPDGQNYTQASGFSVNQLMPHGTPPMFPEPLVITEKYARREPYPFTLDPTIGPSLGGGPPAPPNYWYSINPDLSDLT